MMKRMNKLLGVVLTLVLLLGMVPVTAVATDEKTEVTQIETRISAEYVPYAGRDYTDLFTHIDSSIYGRAQNSGSDWIDDTGVTIDIKGDGDFNEWYDIRYQFEAGRTYTAEYTYMINPAYEETYKFTESTMVALTNPDPSKCTITGVVTEVRDSGRIVDVLYTMTIAGERSYPDIESVTLQKITTPADGVPAETTALMYSNCTLTSQSWSPNVSTFEAGNTYTLTVNLHANEGYKFADDFAPVLGIEGYEKEADTVELLNDNKDAAVSFTYNVGDYIYIDTLQFVTTWPYSHIVPTRETSGQPMDFPFDPADGVPFENRNKALGYSDTTYWYNETDGHKMDYTKTFEAGKVYSISTVFDIKKDLLGEYRFAENATAVINGPEFAPSGYQVECDSDGTSIIVKFLFTAQFPDGEGSYTFPAMCYSYAEFKYAMESPDISHVALANVNETMPVGEEGLVTGIKVNGIKSLHLLGDATFTAPASDVTTYAALLHVTAYNTLNISGAGSLTFRAVANDSFNAVIYNQGGSVNISEGTLIGSYNTAVYGKAIWQEYGELRISGGQLFAENALAPGNLPSAHTAVYINGGQAWIQGGTFKTENVIDTIDPPYGLEIGEDATVELSGGTFHGIVLPSDSTPLANYMDEETYTPLSDGNWFNPKSEHSQEYTESGKVVRIAWLIDHVDVHINTPIAGVEISENYFNIPTSGCKVTMYYPQWYKNGEPITYGTFEAGASYKVVVWVDAKADYGAEFSNGVTVAINNQPVAVDRKSSHLIAVEYDFGVCPATVPEVALTVTAPKEGSKPSYTIGCGSDAYYPVGGSNNYTEYRQWYESSNGIDWTEMSTSTQFKAGYYYKVYVDIRTNKGYEFPLIDVGTIQPDVTATVNGYAATVHEAYDQDPSRYITVEYNFGECNDEVVENITITNIDAPVAGRTPDYLANCFGTGYSMAGTNSGNWKVNGIVWLRDGNIYTGSIMDNTEKFQPGHAYTVMIDLVADNGYTFRFNHGDSIYAAATINGNTAQINVDNCSTEEYQVWYTFTCEQQEITSVMLYDLDAPQGGEVPDTSVTPAYPEYYTVESVTWTDIEGGAVGETFETGVPYIATIVVKSAQLSGADVSVFDPGCAVYIDGKEVTDWRDSVTVENNTVTIVYGFRKGAAAPDVSLYAFLTQPQGGTLTAGESHTASWQVNFNPSRTEVQEWNGSSWVCIDTVQSNNGSAQCSLRNMEGETRRFRIVAYIGNEAAATSQEFSVTWTEAVTLSWSGNKCTVTLKKSVPNVLIIAASYEGGKMVTSRVVTSTLTLTGDSVKVFFLTPGSFDPLREFIPSHP